MLIEENSVRILTDPGTYSTQQNTVRDIDVILITHEHADHLHIDSLKALLQNNPQAVVVTHTGVGTLLEKENIPFTLVEHGEQLTLKGVLVEGLGKEHAIMHPSLPIIHNTGYFIADRLFYPGDAFTDPGKPVELLALPVAGPWMKLADAIDYALRIKPTVCFPIHEGILKSPGSTHVLPLKILEPHGITFTILEIDKEYEF